MNTTTTGAGTSTTSSDSKKQSSSPESSPPSSSRAELRQMTIDDNFETTSEEKKGQLNIACAKMFPSCGIPFKDADSSSFKELMKALRPSYTPPTSKELKQLFREIQENDATGEFKNMAIPREDGAEDGDESE